MERLKKFALKRPFVFGLVLFTAYVLLVALTYPVHFLFPQSDAGQLFAEALSKFITFLAFVLVLWRFGWIKASRISAAGKAGVWLVTALILLYKVSLELYAFTGDLSIPFPAPLQAVAQLVYSLQTGLVEETLVRGLVLVAMITAWGDSKRGQVRAVVLSSIFFGIIHLFNLITNPSPAVIFQAIVTTLPGVLYASLVLHYQTLWPAIVLHWLTNAAVNIKLIALPEFQETFAMWLTFAVGLLPLLALSAYLVWKLPEPYLYEEEVTLPSDPME